MANCSIKRDRVASDDARPRVRGMCQWQKCEGTIVRFFRNAVSDGRMVGPL